MKLVFWLLLSASIAWGGELTRRYELTLERVLQGGDPRYDLDLLAADVIPDDSRVFTNFSGDLSGRYLGALVSAGRSAEALAVLPKLLEHQRPDGRFGNPLSPDGATDDDMARLWGAGRMLVGLAELYQATEDPRALEAAVKLGDWLLAQASRFNAEPVRTEFYSGRMATGYICWTQNVEALALLAEIDPEHADRYLAAAREIAAMLERRPGQHVHGWLTTLRGMARMPSLLASARTSVAEFAKTDDLLPMGSVSEYFQPGLSRDEGCAHADWVRLNLQLGGDQRLATAEAALFNGFYPNQSSSGGFGHLKFSARGIEPGHEEAWWCCTLHGLRAFREIRAAAFSNQDGTPRYRLPVDGRYADDALELQADSTLEDDSRVTIQVLSGKLTGLAVRQPEWSGPLRFERAEETVDDPAVLDPPLQPDESLVIVYDPLERTVDGVEYLGPWILAAPMDAPGSRVRLADRTWQEPEVEWRFLPAERALPIQQESRLPRLLRLGLYAALAAALLLYSIHLTGRRSD